ncbi:MAG: hypothetical protein COV66_10915 [Nitrospinae bacterium CG11_big_fil_rev_8_21_14_0_20_45_15]|nr:MAG: hypothetical protein COV66_10915 [Nitrospinae bacterium CG11_big_fil_rev_8_21_14_0_20_45_15]
MGDTPEEKETVPAEQPAETAEVKPKVAPKAAPAKEAGEAGEEKPKPAPKAAPAKAEELPWIDNGNGTITDPNTGWMWKQSDAWVDTHKFYLWKDHKEYVDAVNAEKFAGYDDWAIPSKAQAMVLFDKNKKKKCLDKNSNPYHIDPLFTAGGAASTWITECSDEQIIRFDLVCGVDTPYPGQDVFSSMRLVRKA